MPNITGGNEDNGDFFDVLACFVFTSGYRWARDQVAELLLPTWSPRMTTCAELPAVFVDAAVWVVFVEPRVQ